jgi:hypothetical protein
MLVKEKKENGQRAVHRITTACTQEVVAVIWDGGRGAFCFHEVE